MQCIGVIVIESDAKMREFGGNENQNQRFSDCNQWIETERKTERHQT